MIELHSVSYWHRAEYENTVIFRDLNLVLPTDRRLVIMGNRGSGKTTLAWLLAGLSRPFQGTIRRNVRVSIPVGFSGGFRTKLTVRQNLKYLSRLYDADEVTAAQYMLSCPFVPETFERKWGTIPGKRRLWLSQLMALCIPFDVYIFDGVPYGETPEVLAFLENSLNTRLQNSGLIMFAANTRIAQVWGEEAAILEGGHVEFCPSVPEGAQRFLGIVRAAAQFGG